MEYGDSSLVIFVLWFLLKIYSRDTMKLNIVLISVIIMEATMLGSCKSNYPHQGEDRIINESQKKIPDDFHSYESELGNDSLALLNKYESLYLNWLFQERRGLFSLEGKRVMFLSGNGGKRVCSKKQYYKNVRECMNHDMFVLPKAEQFLELPTEYKNQHNIDAVVAYDMKKALSLKHIDKLLNQ